MRIFAISESIITAPYEKLGRRFLFVFIYFNSCVIVLKTCVSKNSFIVMLNPSQSIFKVTIPGFLLFPYKIFLIVDGATPDSIASLYMV